MKKTDRILLMFAEWCLNTPLLEMASDRNDKISKIQSKSDTINEHLIKLYLMPNSLDRSHWLLEVNSRFNEITRLTWGKKRRFDKEDYYEWIFSNYYYSDIKSIRMSAIGDTINYLKETYLKEHFIEYNINDIVLKLGELFKEICKHLESGTYTFQVLKDEVSSLV